MSRLFWTAVGAVGGILAYRKWEQMRDQAAAQGMVATAQQVGAAAFGAVNAVRQAAQQGGTR